MVTVLITGGSGFLGRHIVKLIATRWTKVKEIRILDLASVEHQEYPNVNIVNISGSILDKEGLCRAFTGVDAVIHCAALVENGTLSTRRKMHQINVVGTSNVVDACRECHVGVLVATGSVYPFLSKGCCIRYADESYPYTLPKDMLYPDYSLSKIQAEQIVLEANEEGTLHTCILRCLGMYGENDKYFIPMAMNSTKYMCGRYPFSLVKVQTLYGGNAAWAHVLAAQHMLDKKYDGGISGKAYFITDDTPTDEGIGGFLRDFLEPLGYKKAPFNLPLYLLLFIAYILDVIIYLLDLMNVDFVITFNSHTAWSAYSSYIFSRESAERDFGYEPLFSYETAHQNSLEYYKQFR
jgi:nucleoside-diphosphate-sugar epimerase